MTLKEKALAYIEQTGETSRTKIAEAVGCCVATAAKAANQAGVKTLTIANRRRYEILRYFAHNPQASTRRASFDLHISDVKMLDRLSRQPISAEERSLVYGPAPQPLDYCVGRQQTWRLDTVGDPIRITRLAGRGLALESAEHPVTRWADLRAMASKEWTELAHRRIHR